jgi:hypothetical protein
MILEKLVVDTWTLPFFLGEKQFFLKVLKTITAIINLLLVSLFCIAEIVYRPLKK